MNKRSYCSIMAETNAFLRMKLESGDDDPIGVAELGLALTSISDLYEDFAISMGASQAESGFLVSDLRKGSAILEFVGMGIGLMDQALILRQFHKAVKTQVTTSVEGFAEGFSKRDDAQARKIEGLARAVADSEDGSLSLAYLKENESEREVLMMTKQDAQKMLENFSSARERAKEDAAPLLEYEKPCRMLMRLYQHNQDPNPSEKKRTSHKAIVRDIDQKPRPLTYLDQIVATELNDIISENPYAGILFDVDIELVKEDSALKAYRLVAIHGWFEDPDMPLLQAS